MHKKNASNDRANPETVAHPARRRLVQALGLGALALPAWSAIAAKIADTGEGVTFADGPRPLVNYPQKRPMIRVHTRPPHLETPFEYFDEGPITANDAFFVRYHLASIPLSVDPSTYRLAIKGSVTTPLMLSLADLKKMGDPVEVVAVNQCSGNSRGFSSPRVFGAQLGNGAMGNARWTGVSLKTVLAKAGLGAGAKNVVFNGLDKPVLPSTSDFRKSLDIDHAMDGEVMLAWSMNGQDLPFLNGYPLKLIVPGYFGTYWVKHLSDIDVIDTEFTGHDAFFMTTAYRVPDNDCQCVAPGTTAAKTRPISTLATRSFITSVMNGATVAAARPTPLKGLAFDGGTGIKTVDVSIDGGQSWRSALLGKDLGKYSFREWTLPVRLTARGQATLMVRATNNAGEVQPATADWNPAGYRRHVIESTVVDVA